MSFSFCNRVVPQRCDLENRAWQIMRMIGVLLLGAIVSVTMVAQTGSRASQAGGIADRSLDARVESVLRQMTLEEKVGQLVQYSAGQPTGPGTGRTDYEDMIA